MTNNTVSSRIAGIFVSILFLFPILAQAQDTSPPRAKNVILMIADGMGFNCDLAGTYYRYGEAGKQCYHDFPVALGCTTFSKKKKDPIPNDFRGYDPEVFWTSLPGGHESTTYTRTTDSAAASTALHSGQKTVNGKIGVTADNKPIELISEIAAKSGRKAGTVTTVYMSHATPAGFSAHCESRGELDDIFKQMVSEKGPLSVVIGSGHPLYERGRPTKVPENGKEKDRVKRFQCVGGEKTWETMKSGEINGFAVVEKRKRFEEIAVEKKDVPDKMVGVVRSYGYLPPVDGNLENIPETKKILENTFPKTEWDKLPSLTTMSLAALNVLNKKNEKGFVVMIEGGAVDRANHDNKIARSVLEHTGFSKAVEAVIDWVEKNSSWDETLLIVTSDHETGQIWGPKTFTDENKNKSFDEGDLFHGFQPVENKGIGNVPGVQYANGGHTNALVPLWAKGAGAGLFRDKIRGKDEKAGKTWNFSGEYVDNTDIFNVMKAVLER